MIRAPALQAHQGRAGRPALLGGGRYGILCDRGAKTTSISSTRAPAPGPSSYFPAAVVATALSATHPRAASQADDKRSGQLFGCANHYEQEWHDELILMMS